MTKITSCFLTMFPRAVHDAFHLGQEKNCSLPIRKHGVVFHWRLPDPPPCSLVWCREPRFSVSVTFDIPQPWVVKADAQIDVLFRPLMGHASTHDELLDVVADEVARLLHVLGSCSASPRLWAPLALVGLQLPPPLVRLQPPQPPQRPRRRPLRLFGTCPATWLQRLSCVQQP